MTSPREAHDDENYDHEAHAVVVDLTMPFFDDMPWEDFCRALGETLIRSANRGGPQMEAKVGRGNGHLTIVSSLKDDGGSLSLYATVKPLAEAQEEANHLYEISKKAGVLDD